MSVISNGTPPNTGTIRVSAARTTGGGVSGAADGAGTLAAGLRIASITAGGTSALDNRMISAVDSDPIAGDNSDGLSGLLQDARILPDSIGVVGADLVDGPPAFFVLPY